jgi:multisubunit Na+/H+ antiporter MnhB subunit
MTNSAASITSAREAAVTLETFKELGGDYEDAVVASFVSLLGDRIDDRVAEAFDEQLVGLEQPGPLRAAMARDRRAELAVVLSTMLMGTIVTVFVSGFAAPALAWTGLAVINIAYLSRRD